jgi:hypothetical protein
VGDRNFDTVVIGKFKMPSLSKRAFVYRRVGPQEFEFDVLYDAKGHNWEVF